jgi:hypothetical protein
MRVLPNFRSLWLLKSKGGALFLRLILGAALFWVVGCKKPIPPAPVAKISSEGIKVTAISLGRPRLAIVNGKQLGEGDEVMASATRLRIVKISDGEIELSSGSQVIMARLLPPKQLAPKR